MKSFGHDMPFEIKSTNLGVPVLIGDDFYDAKDKWQAVWDNSVDTSTVEAQGE